MKLFGYPETKKLSSLIEERKGKVENIEVVKLNETDHITQLLVFIKTAEVPHYHAYHDLTFIVVEGEGELYLDGRKEVLKRGDVAFIPKGKVHYYTNRGEISVLLAVFSPAYDGSDSVKVEL